MKFSFRFAPLLLVTIPLAHAATIVSAVDSTTPNSLQLNLPGSAVTSAAVISWTQSITYTNVSIDAYIFAEIPTTPGGQPEQYAAYLTNSIGPGTTAGNNIELPITGLGQPFTPPAPGTPTTLFSGMTLGPGTYYLTIQALNQSTGGFLWQSKAGLSPTFGTGVSGGEIYMASSDGSVGSLNSLFAPASVLPQTNIGGSVMYTITGDAAVPEPSSVVLAGLGLVAVSLIRRRTRA